MPLFLRQGRQTHERRHPEPLGRIPDFLHRKRCRRQRKPLRSDRLPRHVASQQKQVRRMEKRWNGRQHARSVAFLRRQNHVETTCRRNTQNIRIHLSRHVDTRCNGRRRARAVQPKAATTTYAQRCRLGRGPIRPRPRGT